LGTATASNGDQSPSSWRRSAPSERRGQLLDMTSCSAYSSDSVNNTGIQTVGQLSEAVAHDFTAERERGMSPTTIHDRVRRLKTWTRWMRKRAWTERDRWEDVQTPRRPRGVRPDRARAARCRVQPVRPAHVPRARTQATLALPSDCGVRRDELCIIKDADVNLWDMQVRVFAPKTRQTRWRLVPFSEETAAMLANDVRLRQRYLARRSRKRARRRRRTADRD
jgi:site-specific recombinase XerC